MATRDVTLTAATITEIREMRLTNPVGGPARFEMNVAHPDDPMPDVRVINLGATSLTPAERTTLINLLGQVLADAQAQAPAYTP